jgi:hypothetical protein
MSGITYVLYNVGSPGSAQASYNGYATLEILEIVRIFSPVRGRMA